MTGEWYPVEPAAHPRFEALYEREFRYVLAYCLRRCPPDDGYDAANEVFTIAWRKIDEVPDGDRARPWLLLVARRVLYRRWRSIRRFRSLAVRARSLRSSGSLDPETVVVQRAEYDAVLMAASRLSDSDREVLNLAAWEVLSHREIAAVLECSIAAVDQRLHRAKKRLAKHYNALNVDAPLLQAAGGDES